MSLPPFGTKEELDAAAAAAAQEAIREAWEREVTYDAQTRHGESQGVCFPPASCGRHQNRPEHGRIADTAGSVTPIPL
jgi:hypothetical protein